MLKTRNQKVVDVNDWDKLVVKTYSRPYNFQQQEGCQDRGIFELTIPSDETMDEEMNDYIPETINGQKMGVKFKTWLSRDPEKQIGKHPELYHITLFWERNFYPDIQTLANDLHAKGLVEAGNYLINIDW